MRTDAAKRQWLAPLVLVFGLAAVLVLTGLIGSTSANAQGAHDHSDLEHHDRFTGPGDKADWPPRPVGATSETQRVADAPSGDSLDGPTSVFAIASNADVVAELGTDWILVSESPARQTKNGYTGAEYTFFSRDNNHTIIVIEDQIGQLDVTTWTSEQMQPIVTAAEGAEAADLGRAWLVANGFPEAADLEGFSIRALDDGQFYDVRMVYVTFSTEAFANPTHSTLVDMTNLVAISGRVL